MSEQERDWYEEQNRALALLTAFVWSFGGTMIPALVLCAIWFHDALQEFVWFSVVCWALLVAGTVEQFVRSSRNRPWEHEEEAQ